MAHDVRESLQEIATLLYYIFEYYIKVVWLIIHSNDSFILF